MSTQNDIQKFYVGYLGRAADQAGMDYWVDMVDNQGWDVLDVAQSFADQPEYQAIYGETPSRVQLVARTYEQLFGREADAEGLEYWVNGGGASVPDNLLVKAFYDGASAADQLVVDNRVEVADYYTANKGGVDDYSQSSAQDVIADVDGTADSVNDGIDAIDALDAAADDSGDYQLTQLADDLTGTSGDDVFDAPVTQNTTGSGQLANTLETGDVLNGGTGEDVLYADLISSGDVGDNFAPAISATTSNIEKVYLRAQAITNDGSASNTTFGATVDAEEMSGVKEWWSDNSRADIRIEDIRSLSSDITIGMTETDPNVSLGVFFNPLYMEGQMSTESDLTLLIQEITDGQAPSATELDNITVREVNFTYNGTDYTLDSDALSDADTWAQLETAITDIMSNIEDLATLTVTHVGNGEFVIHDTAGGTFAAEEDEALIFGTTADTDVRNRVEVGRIVEEGPTSVNIVLDGVGNGSEGGTLNVAAMSGDRGIEIFNVEVDRDSHLNAMASVNSPNNPFNEFGSEQQLEEVYVTHADGATGTLAIGDRSQDANGVSTTDDDRLDGAGLTDVRVFDASGFDSELAVYATLTGNAFDKYLLGVEEAVQFDYILGDAGSNLTLDVDNTLAGDVDFALSIEGGDGDDRINLGGLAVKSQTSVDGANGNNTLEITTSTGFAATQNGFNIAVPAGTDLTAAETSFEEVANLDTVILASDSIDVGNQVNAGAAAAAAVLAEPNLGDTTHDITTGGLSGISEFVIATSGFEVDFFNTTTNLNDTTFTAAGTIDTRLINLDADIQSVEISGMNQTLGAGNSDNNQAFGIIRFTDTDSSDGILDLALNNTARATGALNVATLQFDGTANDVRDLVLDSVGTRDTANSITTLNGGRVSTFDLVGTQDLSITNLASAANSTSGTVSAIDSLLVDGSELGGDLYLGVTGAVITAVDAALGTDRTVELVGTEGSSDQLNIRDGVTTTAATTISGFETVSFGDDGATLVAATNFNATNVSDVELYDLVDSGVAIAMTNLRSTETVQINSVNSGDGTTFAGDVTLSAATPTSGSSVAVNFDSDGTVGGAVDASYWGVGALTVANLNVQDYSTITLDMGGSTVDSYDYSFNLNLLANATSGEVNARTLEIVGGAGAGANQDTLTLGTLDTALTLVDFSDYNGSFTTAGWDSLLGSNATVAVNEFDFTFDVGGDNTVIAIPASTGGAAVDTAEIITVDLTAAPGITGGAGLADGDSITINFAGGEYVFTNTTGAAIAEGSLDEAIVADAANHPDAFSIVAGLGDALTLTAAIPGDMPAATITSLQAGVAGANDAAVTAAVVVATAGDLVATNVTGYDLVTAAPEYITAFDFNEDAASYGVIWQIDNFMAFEAGENVDLSNQSIIDLRDLGVDSAADINVLDGAAYLASLTAAEIADYNTAQGAGWAALNFVAGNTVVTSNEGMDYTILLTGVDSADLVNENFSGIA